MEILQRERISLSKTIVHKSTNCELKLHSICRRKKPAYHRGLAHRIFLNLLKRNFSPEHPNRVWCTDFTYITLTNGTITIIVLLSIYTTEVLLPVKKLFYQGISVCAHAYKGVIEFKVYSTKPESAFGSSKSGYFRKVCAPLPEAWDFSKHEPCGLSV